MKNKISKKRMGVSAVTALLANIFLFAAVGRWYATNQVEFQKPTHIVHVPSFRHRTRISQKRLIAKRHEQRLKLVMLAKLVPQPKITHASARHFRVAPRIQVVRLVTRTPSQIAELPRTVVPSHDRYIPTFRASTLLHLARVADVPPISIPSVDSPTPQMTAPSIDVQQMNNPAPNGMIANSDDGHSSSDSPTGSSDAGSSGNSSVSGVLPFGLRAPEGGTGTNRIVYVLDVSQSMKSRLPRAKEELRNCLANLSPDDLFDIIAFGGQTNPMENYLEPATSDNIEEAKNFLQHIEMIPSTNLEDAVSQALFMPHVNEVVVITDGVPTSGETNFKTLAREIRNRNIEHARIDTVGLVGINSDGTLSAFDATSLLRQLAADSNGDTKIVPLGIATSD